MCSPCAEAGSGIASRVPTRVAGATTRQERDPDERYGPTRDALQTHERAPLDQRLRTLLTLAQPHAAGTARVGSPLRVVFVRVRLRRHRVLRAAASRGPRRDARRARPGVRRSAPAAHPRPQRPADPRQRPGGGRRGARRTPGRGVVHVVGDRRGAPGPARAAPLPRHDRGALGRRALRRCCTPWRGAATSRPGPSASTRSVGSAVARPRTPGASSRSSTPTTRSAPSSRSPRPRRSRRSSWTPAPRWAGSPCPTGWSVAAGSAHKWGGPAGVGVLLVRKGTRMAQPVPRGRPRRRAGLRVRERPRRAGRRRRAPGRGRRARRGQRPPARTRRPDPGPGRRDPRHRGGRRPGRPAPPPGHVLVPLRRRRGASSTRSTVAASRSPAARPAPPPPSSPATCSRRWAR